MPSDSMNIQEQGFRSRMFGGFDKNDVLAYMNTLANEAQQHELEYQEKLRQLQAQLDDLRSQRSDAEAHIEALKAELAAANQLGFPHYIGRGGRGCVQLAGCSQLLRQRFVLLLQVVAFQLPDVGIFLDLPVLALHAFSDGLCFLQLLVAFVAFALGQVSPM